MIKNKNLKKKNKLLPTLISYGIAAIAIFIWLNQLSKSVEKIGQTVSTEDKNNNKFSIFSSKKTPNSNNNSGNNNINNNDNNKNKTPNSDNNSIRNSEFVIRNSNVPKRLEITVQVDSPDDLKVTEGETVKKGQIIATRDRARRELERQKQQIELSLNKVKSFKPLPPTPPKDIPVLKSLPPVSYLEYKANVEKAQTLITFIENQIQIKEDEINYLEGLDKIDEMIISHEYAKVKKLKENLAIAIKDYQLAKGKLETAKNRRNYLEYQDNVNKVRRIEQINQQQHNYERELALFQQRRAEQEFRITQLTNSLNAVQEKLSQLANSNSPYDATVRRVKWLGQSADGSLNAEISLMVDK